MAVLSTTPWYRIKNIAAIQQIANDSSLTIEARKYLIDWLKNAPEQGQAAIQNMTRIAIWKTGPYANLDQATAESYTAQAAAAAGRAKASSAGSAAASAAGVAQEQAQARAAQESSDFAAQVMADIAAINPDLANQGGAVSALGSSLDVGKVLLWGGGAVAAFWLLKKVMK